MKNITTSYKVGIIGIRGLPAMYGAFDRFVEQLVFSKNIKKKTFFFMSVVTHYLNTMHLIVQMLREYSRLEAKALLYF